MRTFLIFVFVTLCWGHNWIHSDGGTKSRCIQACAIEPAPPRAGPRKPHLQVAQNQEFFIPWASGHQYSIFYFAVMNAKYEGDLKYNTRTALEDYVQSAPSSAHLWKNDERFLHMHQSCSYLYTSNTKPKSCRATYINQGKTGNGNGDPYDLNGKPIPTDHNMYFEQPPAWKQFLFDDGFTEDEIYEVVNFKYQDWQISGDARVEYHNEKYPWLEAVHKFPVVEYDNPQEWDVARFQITGKDGPGQYLIHMVWNGYRDVIDIDLFPEGQETTDIYGSAGQIEWVKTEHCQYPNYLPGTPNQGSPSPVYVVKSDSPLAVKACIDSCKEGNENRCKAMNVVPLYTPGVKEFEMESTWPWNMGYETEDATWKNFWSNLPEWADETSMLCYGFNPLTPTDPTFNAETETLWYIRLDPDDPIFYSSCYRLEQTLEFSEALNGICEACQPAEDDADDDVEISKWSYGTQCITCGDASAETDINSAQWWVASEDECTACF